MLKLKVEKREIFGKKLKKVRATGKLPVVVYGREVKPTPYFVDAKQFKKVFDEAGESTVVTLEADEGGHKVLIQEVTHHPVSNVPIHADFYAFSKGQTIKLKVPIEYVGVAPVSKEAGVAIVKVMHELEIEALPEDLPHHLDVDLAPLTAIGTHVLVSDIVVPKGVKILNQADQVVVAANEIKEEVEETPIDISEIEVEKRGKEEVAEGEAPEAGAGAPEAKKE